MIRIIRLFLCKGRYLYRVVSNESRLNKVLFNVFFKEKVENVAPLVPFFKFNVVLFRRSPCRSKVPYL